MMAVLLIMSGLLAFAVLTEWIACLTAPLGYQDETGFHLGPEKAAEADEAWGGNPS